MEETTMLPSSQAQSAPQWPDPILTTEAAPAALRDQELADAT